MTHEEIDALTLARMYHSKWRSAIYEGQYELADEYHRQANYWKQRADIQEQGVA